jgi:branched-chain amino acid transport system substrate-binding protein
MRRSPVLLATLVAMGVVLAACADGSSQPTPSAPSPHAGVIAVEGPMTGSQSATGIDMERGAQLAVDQINKVGGVDRAKLTLLKEDDAASPTRGLKAASDAIAGHAFGVVGPFNSSIGVADLPVYRKAGMPIVRLTSSVRTEGFGVTTQPMDSQVAPVEVQQITVAMGAKRPAIIYDDSTYTSGIATQVQAGLQRAGDPVVAVEPVTDKQTDFSTQLGQIAGLHPDLLYIAAYGGEAGHIALAASTMHLGACFVDLAAQGPDFVSAATAAVAQSCVSSGVPSATQFTAANAYVSSYQDAYHQTPGTWGTFSYDSVEILAAAVKRAGGWHQAAVSSALSHTFGFAGITGSITIDPATGNRVDSPVAILDINASGNYVIDPAWARATGFPLPPTS